MKRLCLPAIVLAVTVSAALAHAGHAVKMAGDNFKGA